MSELKVTHKPFICVARTANGDLFRIRVNDEHLERKMERMGIVPIQTVNITEAKYPFNSIVLLTETQQFELTLVLGPAATAF